MKQFIDLPPIQIPIKSCSSFLESRLVTFLALRLNPSIGGAGHSLYDTVPLAYSSIRRYINSVQQKAVGLALVGYELVSAYSPLRAFFMRNISMRSHVMAKLWRDTFACAGILTSLSTNPLQLCHPHLVVNGKASKQSLGAH